MNDYGKGRFEVDTRNFYMRVDGKVRHGPQSLVDPDSLTGSINMGWNPDTDALAQILGLLRESQSPDTVVQQSVQQVERGDGALSVK